VRAATPAPAAGLGSPHLRVRWPSAAAWGRQRLRRRGRRVVAPSGQPSARTCLHGPATGPASRPFRHVRSTSPSWRPARIWRTSQPG